ncbi:hypothetical protein IPA_06320 [Ignicoccus pacificus DSM 13166]|uniref:Uncharacterized protein n=1 Tax=Ignicoccus pacificus DSM 13166 TaxID=940294 RepID=A0A977KBH9_9CREN|nr:hypothetical protein IPA_06320 [Ignicoccus pacificus DSM 13166]
MRSSSRWPFNTLKKVVTRLGGAKFLDELLELDEAYSIAERLYQELDDIPELALLLVHLRRVALNHKRLVFETSEAAFLAGGTRVPTIKKSIIFYLKELLNDVKMAYKRVVNTMNEFEESTRIVSKVLEDLRIEFERRCSRGDKSYCEAKRELIRLIEIWASWISKRMDSMKEKVKELERMIDEGSLKEIEEALDALEEERTTKKGFIGRLKDFLSRKPPEEGEGE